MTESLANNDDAGAAYLAEREIAGIDDVIARARARLPAVAPDAASPPAAAAPPAKTIGQKIGAIGGDVIKGATEALPQAVGGVSDFVHQTFTAAGELADWLNENVADLRVPIPKTGVGAIDELLADPARAIAGQKNEVAPAQSVTGGIVREAARFLTGFKFAKGLVGGGGGGIPAGALTDFVAQDPDAPRLADLWNKLGLPGNALTDYLASDPSDNDVEKRFKNALEGAGIGALTEGILRGARYVRSKWLASKTAAAGADDALAAAKAQYGEIVPERDFIILGDPQAPAVQVSKAPEPAALAAARRSGKLAAGMKEAADLQVPDDVAAKGLAGKPAGSGTRRTGESVSPGTGGPMQPANTAPVADGPLIPPAAERAVKSGSLSPREFTDEVEAHLRRAGVDVSRGGGESTLSQYLTIKQPGDAAATVQVRISDHFSTTGDFQFLTDATGKIAADPLAAAEAAARKFVQNGGTINRPVAAPMAKGLVNAGETAGGNVYINFARIDSPDSVRRVMRDMAEAFAPSIDEAKRGVQSNKLTAKLADDLGMTVDDLLQRRRGQPFNAEEALAARRLWAASGEKLLEVAQKATAPNAGAVDQFNFRKMLATHYAIQAEVVGARTETARALQAWAIPAGSGVEQARAIQTVLDGMGGPEMSQQIAKRLAILAQTGATPEAMAEFTRKGWGAASLDAVREAWVNGLLSSPKTHLVNTMSNSIVLVQQIYERKAAELISGALGTNAVAPGEAAAMAHGLIESQKDAWRLAWKALKTGETGASLGKIDLPIERAITGEAFRQSDTAIGKAIDYIGATFRVPGKLLGAEDELFKTIGYRMELRAQAVRQAVGEGLRDDALGRRVAEILTAPPEHIRIAAADAALYSTFTNATGEIGKSMLQFRNRVPGAWLVLPFVRTPVNIARYAFERSPLAPLVGQWRADVAAGGARQALALARMATGTTIMLTAAGYADQGRLSGYGPDDPGEREALRRQGWQPYSIKAGNKWVGYNRTDPLGATLGLAADFAELVRRREIEPDELDEVNEVLAAAIASAAHTAVSKTYMSGVAEFIDMMENPEQAAPQYIARMLGSAVPAGAAAAEQIADPTAREQFKLFDYAQSRIAGLSARLPPRRDLWGEPIRPDSGFGSAYDALSPVQISRDKPRAIDAEIVRLNLDLRRLSKKADFDGVPVNFRDWPEVYDAYVRLAGNDLKHPVWGLGARDFLDAVVSGKHDLSEVYRLKSDGEDGGKAAFIKQTISDFRALARREVKARFPAFADEVAALSSEWRARRAPAVQ